MSKNIKIDQFTSGTSNLEVSFPQVKYLTTIYSLKNFARRENGDKLGESQPWTFNLIFDKYNVLWPMVKTNI